MKKGISFYFGYIYKDRELQVKDISSAGFDCVMDTADPKYNKENSKLCKQIKWFKKHGLGLSSLHMRYRKDDVENFWLDNKISKKLETNLIKDIKIAHKYNFKCVVVHLVGEYTEIGQERLKRILTFCEKYDVPLALENLNRNNKLLDTIYKNIKSKYLGFCYDAGHAHLFEPEIDHLTKYKNKVIALHLHDNLGLKVSDKKLEKMGYKNGNPDMHTLNKYGNIDWKQIAERLAKVKQDVSLDYEVVMAYRNAETPQEVLKEVYKQACELESLIKEFKQKNKKTRVAKGKQ